MSDVNTLLKRAKSALIAHDYALAAKIYKNLIMEEPDNVDYKIQLGNLYTKAGKDDQALTIFQQINKIDSENFDVLIAISGIYRRQKKYEESVGILERALVMCKGSSKDRAKISYNLGFTYRQMGNYDDAIHCFEEVVEENPSDVLANNHLGAIYALQEKHSKAIEAYNRGLKFDSNHPILQFNIAKSYAAIGDKTKALGFYEGALRAKPGWTEAIEAYSELLLSENKVNEADEVVTQALKINPDDVKMHTAKGNVYNRQSIFEDAETEFKKALDVDESYKKALTGLAHSLENQGKLDEAIETIVKAEKLHPGDPKIMRQSAHIHISANKLEDALSKISKLQEIDKNDVEALNLLGQYYICNDDAQKTEDCFAQIKRINPDYNEVYGDWGERYIQKGNIDKAEPYLQAAIQKNPKDSDAMVSLGELYEKQNMLGKALQFYKKASAVDTFNQRSKDASERIMGDDANLDKLDLPGNEKNVDYDALFSGGKLDADFTDLEANSLETSESPVLPEIDAGTGETVTEAETGTTSDETQPEISDAGKTEPLSDDSASFETEFTAEETSEQDEGFDFDNFGMNKLAEASSGVEDVESVANLLATDENAFDEGNPTDFDELIDDGAPLDEENSVEPEFTPLPDGTEYLDDSSTSVEVETPGAAKREISEDSLDMLEEQIKRANEFAEKANYAAESAWQAANRIADAVQVYESAKPAQPEEIPAPATPDAETEEPVKSEPVISEPENVEERQDEVNMVEEQPEENATEAQPDDITEDDSFLDEDLLSEEEKLAESEILDDNELEGEDELFDQEVMEEEQMNEEYEETTAVKEAPKVDDVTLRRAIDMLPSIIAAIEDRSVIYRFRAFLSMFKTLREMLEYLPPEQRREFMTSRNRLLLDYVISKLSGKPGLYATTKALLRSGLIHENPENKPSEKEGIELVKEVLADLRTLSEGLEDDTLREVLNAEADSLEKNI